MLTFEAASCTPYAGAVIEALILRKRKVIALSVDCYQFRHALLSQRRH